MTYCAHGPWATTLDITRHVMPMVRVTGIMVAAERIIICASGRSQTWDGLIAAGRAAL